MDKIKKIIYVNANAKKHEYIYTGIKFSEFIEYLQNPIDNIILLKANYMGNNFQKNFELVEGCEHINKLSSENIYNWGDFCFVDYSQKGSINNMADKEISELLYLAHMHYPLYTPFFKSLENNFVYLSHDDGFYCKLYCKNRSDLSNIVVNKIQKYIEIEFNCITEKIDNKIQNSLFDIAENGLLIDIDELKVNDNKKILNIYSIGKYLDMNEILNNYKTLKSEAIEVIKLIYVKGKWNLYSNG